VIVNLVGSGLEVWGSIFANGATFSEVKQRVEGNYFAFSCFPVTFNNCNIYNAVVGLRLLTAVLRYQIDD
jgi:hypothetical protein